jgi:hypothetical protein
MGFKKQSEAIHAGLVEAPWWGARDENVDLRGERVGQPFGVLLSAIRLYLLDNAFISSDYDLTVPRRSSQLVVKILSQNPTNNS